MLCGVQGGGSGAPRGADRGREKPRDGVLDRVDLRVLEGSGADGSGVACWPWTLSSWEGRSTAACRRWGAVQLCSPRGVVVQDCRWAQVVRLVRLVQVGAWDIR